MDLNERCYQPLDNPPPSPDNDRPVTEQEHQLLTQLGVNILALYRQKRYAEADEIERRLGFDHCSAAVATANSQLAENLPQATV